MVIRAPRRSGPNVQRSPLRTPAQSEPVSLSALIIWRWLSTQDGETLPSRKRIFVHVRLPIEIILRFVGPQKGALWTRLPQTEGPAELSDVADGSTSQSLLIAAQCRSMTLWSAVCTDSVGGKIVNFLSPSSSFRSAWECLIPKSLCLET
jgi:hypothetical protein